MNDEKPDTLAVVFFGGVVVLVLSLYHCMSSSSTRLEKGTARLVRESSLLFPSRDNRSR